MLRRLILPLLLLAPAAAAQAPADSVAAWALVVDGRPEAWPAAPALPPDSLGSAVRAALAEQARQGYYAAAVDSVVAEGPHRTIHLSRGGHAAVASVRIEGATVLDAERLREGWATRPGRPLDPDALAADLRALLRRYEQAGYPLATADLAAADLRADELHLVVRVEEGEALTLAGVELTPASRTSGAFAARVAGLRVGGPLAPYDPAAVRRELEATGLFEEVGAPELALSAEGGAVVRVPVVEGQPGAFDLVVGYLPPGGPEEDGRLVGNGSLVLSNLFGQGRRLALELVRNPGLVSSLDVRATDPFLFGLPLRLEGRFAGYQQDSTFSRQQLGVEVGYRFAPGLEGVVTASREFVEAGVAGDEIVAGLPRVAAADAWFAGVGVRYRRVDRPLNPRRGLAVSTLVEQGVKERALPDSSEGIVTVAQQRLFADARLFVPTLRRQLLVLGGDAALLLGDAYDDADLFRFGGARSLRGYDEERFRGNVVARALAEYRYQLDRTSFAFAFFDLGHVGRPATPGAPAEASVRPGYGLGLQYRTPLGVVGVSYALNPEDGPTRGKVHVGLSVGL